MMWLYTDSFHYVFSKPAFQSLDGEMARKFLIYLDKDNIRNMDIEEAKKQKSVMKEEIAGKCVHLKIEACTRIRTNYFAINVGYFGADGTVKNTNF